MKKNLVVITGASSGIGAATAVAFSQAGYPLLLLARRLEKLKTLNLPNTICEKVDVTDLPAMRDAIAKAESIYGHTDCLINNAGVLLLGNVETQNPAEWQNMLNINVMGVLNGVGIVLNEMIKRKGGTIINVSSIAGRSAFPDHAVYCATKFAVHGLTETIRQETAQHNVRLITISPGIVETEVLNHTTSQKIVDDYKNYKKQIEVTINSEDVARSILFAYSQPQNVCIREIILAPTRQDT